MRVRIIRKPEFMAVHHVQVKRWWWPFWSTVIADTKDVCERVAKAIIEGGSPNEVIFEGETK